MDEGKPISRFAERFIARKLEQISNSAYEGSGGQREYENKFVDGVVELMERIKRPDLRRHFFSEAVKGSEYLRQVQEAMVGGIRKIVWDGPYVETDQGRTIRGAVGRTYGGKYRVAEVSLHQEIGPTNKVSFSEENWKWGERFYSHKEHAIYAARESVARTLKAEQWIEFGAPMTVATGKSPAAKYGGNDIPSKAIRPPSRSR